MLTITLSWGTWLIPLTITLIAFGASGWWSRPDGPLYRSWGGFEALILPMVATVVSALAWGAWWLASTLPAL